MDLSDKMQLLHPGQAGGTILWEHLRALAWWVTSLLW
jgi:hypothetical protein